MTAPTIIPFEARWAAPVETLFTRINLDLAPPDMAAAFEAYIQRSLTEEIGRIDAYYAEKDGGFWLVVDGEALLGMFGLERAGPAAFELRRMYVAPEARRRGLARTMMAHAEATCRTRGADTLLLSTSEAQDAALAFYRAEGFEILREETAEAASNKTVGAGIRRYYMSRPVT
ncbi:MAG: GNAT family N-acetyltransferase [Pseudomonadota bacterium]